MCIRDSVCTGEIQEEDYTIEAQKALSAMVRSGCRFGRVLIMDILMGADNRRIRETGFQHLPTYGVGKDRTRRFWKYLIDALTRQGLAAIEGEELSLIHISCPKRNLMPSCFRFSAAMRGNRASSTGPRAEKSKRPQHSFRKKA